MDQEEQKEKLSTEGDLIVLPPQKTLWQRSTETWVPFSQTVQPLCFYDPEQHLYLAQALWNAPIQSCERVCSETIDE
jgi:hypothetical protein